MMVRHLCCSREYLSFRIMPVVPMAWPSPWGVAIVSIPFFNLTGLMATIIMFVVNTVFHQKLNMSTEATMPGVPKYRADVDGRRGNGQYADPAVGEAL